MTDSPFYSPPLPPLIVAAAGTGSPVAAVSSGSPSTPVTTGDSDGDVGTASRSLFQRTRGKPPATPAELVASPAWVPPTDAAGSSGPPSIPATAGGLDDSAETAPRTPFRKAGSESSTASVELVASVAAPAEPVLTFRPATTSPVVVAVLPNARRASSHHVAAASEAGASNGGEAARPTYQPTVGSLGADGSCRWPPVESSMPALWPTWGRGMGCPRPTSSGSRRGT